MKESGAICTQKSITPWTRKIVPFFAKFVLFGMLVLVSLGSVLLDGRYVEVGKPLLRLDGVITLQNDETGRSASRIFPLRAFPREGRVRVRLEASCNNVVPGVKPWHRARVLLVQYKKGKADWNLPHQVVSFEGTQPWLSFTVDFHIAPETGELRLICLLGRCRGTLMVKNIQVNVIQQQGWYEAIRCLVWGIWVLFVLTLSLQFIRVIPGCWNKGGLILALAFLLFGVTVPPATKDILKRQVEEEIVTVAPAASKVLELDSQVRDHFSGNLNDREQGWLDVTKIGHFVFFALLALLLFAKQEGGKPAELFLDLVLLAISTELLQLYIDGRSPLPSDVAIDAAGIATGFVLGRLEKGGQIHFFRK